MKPVTAPAWFTHERKWALFWVLLAFFVALTSSCTNDRFAYKQAACEARGAHWIWADTARLEQSRSLRVADDAYGCVHFDSVGAITAPMYY